MRVRADWPGEEPAQRPAWPWGDYETAYLATFREVMQQKWAGPLSRGERVLAKQVMADLEAAGVGHRKAEALAGVVAGKPRGGKARGGAK